ncbi:MAG: hypothetical protein JST49_15925 [Bacteroidetes bacterium]|nr:hypothetical protein [Bacteroidota bacterium]
MPYYFRNELMNLLKGSLSCFVLTLIALSLSMGLRAQDAAISYFELNVEPTVDSTQHNIYFMLAVNGSNKVSSISIDVKGEEGQAIASISSSIAALKSSYPYRIENGVLYLTIETGAHAPSLYYQATAILTPTTGEPLEYIKTKQM